MKKVYIVHYYSERGEEEIVGCSLRQCTAVDLMREKSSEIVRDMGANVTHSDPSRVDLECLDGYYYNLTLKEFDLL